MGKKPLMTGNQLKEQVRSSLQRRGLNARGYPPYGEVLSDGTTPADMPPEGGQYTPTPGGGWQQVVNLPSGTQRALASGEEYNFNPEPSPVTEPAPSPATEPAPTPIYGGLTTHPRLSPQQIAMKKSLTRKNTVGI